MDIGEYKVPIYRDFEPMILDFPPISVQHLLPESVPPPVTLSEEFQAFITACKNMPISGFQWIEEEQ